MKINKFIIRLINDYQATPHTHKKCRFLPTCSEYAKISFQRFNFFYASYLTIKRLLKCNPLHKMAYDPVPLEKKFRTKYGSFEDACVDYRFKHDIY